MNFLRMPDQFYPGYLPFIKIGSLRYPSRCAAVADTQGIVLTGERHLYFGSGSALLNYGRNHAGIGNYLYFSGNLGSRAPLDIPPATDDPFWRGL